MNEREELVERLMTLRTGEGPFCYALFRFRIQAEIVADEVLAWLKTREPKT